MSTTVKNPVSLLKSNSEKMWTDQYDITPGDIVVCHTSKLIASSYKTFEESYTEWGRTAIIQEESPLIVLYGPIDMSDLTEQIIVFNVMYNDMQGFVRAIKMPRPVRRKNMCGYFFKL